MGLIMISSLLESQQTNLIFLYQHVKFGSLQLKPLYFLLVTLVFSFEFHLSRFGYIVQLLFEIDQHFFNLFDRFFNSLKYTEFISIVLYGHKKALGTYQGFSAFKITIDLLDET